MKRQTRRLGRPPKTDAPPTRERILDAALEHFADRGLSGTSIRQLAAAVGITDAAIYFHFSSKQAILDALLEESGVPLLERLSVSLEVLAEQDPSTTIPDLFGRIVDAFDQPRARLLTSMLLRHEPQRVGQALSQVEGALHGVMQAWMDAGRVRDDVPAALLVWTLLSPLATLRLTKLHAQATPQERAQARSLAREHLAFFVHAHVRTP